MTTDTHDDTHEETRPRPSLTRTLIGGVVAGVAASAAMNGFQTLVARAEAAQGSSGGSDSDREPSTVKIADAVSEAVTGHDVAERNQAAAGRAVHYATGVGLGVLYVTMGRWLPSVRSGWGTGYAIAAAAVLDEGLVPALGLAPNPTDVPVSSHAYSAASHAAFGLALETATRVVVGSPRV